MTARKLHRKYDCLYVCVNLTEMLLTQSFFLNGCDTGTSAAKHKIDSESFMERNIYLFKLFNKSLVEFNINS